MKRNKEQQQVINKQCMTATKKNKCTVNKQVKTINKQYIVMKY